LHTEASHRFERGVDPNAIPDASLRCAQLMIDLAGARVTGPMTDVYPEPIPPAKVPLRPARTRVMLGVNIPREEQGRILGALGLRVAEPPSPGDSFEVTVPTARPDLTRECDLIEEIARVYGYDRVPATVPDLHAAPGPSGDRVGDAVREALRGQGLDEVVTYAFVSPAGLQLLQPETAPLRIQNPLREEQSAMRTTLALGLLHALQRNVTRGTTDVRLFEIGEVFHPRGGRELPEERRRVAGLLAGQADGWLRPGQPLGVFDIKGVVEELLAALGHTGAYAPSRATWLHPGVQASVSVGGRPVGHLGELHPELQRKLGLETRALVFELDLEALGEAPWPRAQELPRFPAVTRDLSFFVAAERTAGEIRKILDGLRDPLCVAVDVLEDYREAGKVPSGQKGMLWSFTYRAADRTLTDAEVQTLHSALVEKLKVALPVTLR
jgi:phenylalanyl-tRNA synthetase beta chain